MSLFLCLGDVHAPFIHKPTFEKVLSFVSKMNRKPDYIVQIGDLYDFYSASRFPKNPNVMTPDQEVKDGRECAEEMWLLLKQQAPKAKCFQLLGNHSVRPMKKLMAVAPELNSFYQIKPFWTFQGVTTIHDPRQELVIEDICFIHGYRTKLGDHAKFLGKKTVVGHSHKGGVHFLTEFGNKNPIWELNCGFIADTDHEALKYTEQKYNHWIRGIGLIDNYGPRFIPL